MSDVLALYRIQELELTIIEDSKRIKAINAQLQDDSALQEAEAAFEAAQSDFAEANKQARDMELEIASETNKRQNAEQALYSGAVKNPKELRDMQMQVEALTSRLAALEIEMRRLADARDDLKGKSDAAETRLQELREARAQENQELLAEKEQLMTQVKAKLSQRKASVDKIPPETFQVYNRLRVKKSNRPMAVLKDKACAICGIEQNSAVITTIYRKGGLVNCQNCSRILIRL